VDTFTYTISDGNGGTSSANVTVTVTSVNDAPVAVNDAVKTNKNTPVVINVLNNDYDTEGDSLTVIAVTQPSNCTAVINPDGTVTYTPDPGFVGTDSFTYTIRDSNGDTSTATVYIIVNDVSEAKNDKMTIGKNGTLTGSVASNDHQTENNTFSLISGPRHGSLSFKADGTFTYTPDPGFNGVDTFVYSITDPSGHISTATVTISVTKPESANNTTVHATSVPMQHTGVPILWALLAVFMIAGGLLTGKRK
jgi:hypothetical protein